MKTVIIGNPGIEWTDNPRALTKDEGDQIKALGRLDGIKLHRQFTSSTLLAANNAVAALQGWGTKP
jgi:hypothetical protein